MDEVGIRELRQDASRYIRRCADGESFVVTDRGRPTALLASGWDVVRLHVAELMDRLVEEGIYASRDELLRTAIGEILREIEREEVDRQIVEDYTATPWGGTRVDEWGDLDAFLDEVAAGDDDELGPW